VLAGSLTLHTSHQEGMFQGNMRSRRSSTVWNRVLHCNTTCASLPSLPKSVYVGVHSVTLQCVLVLMTARLVSETS
jgi:hypothetical protein